MNRIPRFASRFHAKLSRRAALPLAALLLAAAPVLATTGSWVHDAVVNDAICTQSATQNDVRVYADGTGGWIVA